MFNPGRTKIGNFFYPGRDFPKKKTTEKIPVYRFGGLCLRTHYVSVRLFAHFNEIFVEMGDGFHSLKELPEWVVLIGGVDGV